MITLTKTNGELVMLNTRQVTYVYDILPVDTKLECIRIMFSSAHYVDVREDMETVLELIEGVKK